MMRTDNKSLLDGLCPPCWATGVKRFAMEFTGISIISTTK